MPPKKRKLWATRTLVAVPPRRHESRAAAYRHVQDIATQYAAGSLRQGTTHVTVFVDERDGRGWQCFERLSLDELVRHDEHAEEA